MSVKSTSWYQVNIFLTFSQFAILSKTHGGGGCGVKLQASALREDIFLFIGKDTWTPVILYIIRTIFLSIVSWRMLKIAFLIILYISLFLQNATPFIYTFLQGLFSTTFHKIKFINSNILL